MASVEYNIHPIHLIPLPSSHSQFSVEGFCCTVATFLKTFFVWLQLLCDNWWTVHFNIFFLIINILHHIRLGNILNVELSIYTYLYIWYVNANTPLIAQLCKEVEKIWLLKKHLKIHHFSSARQRLTNMKADWSPAVRRAGPQWVWSPTDPADPGC